MEGPEPDSVCVCVCVRIPDKVCDNVFGNIQPLEWDFVTRV